MSYSCKILLDSISETGKRLTTMEITFPRIVLAEFNTHRMFSRNSASSGAIPFKKQIEKVKNDPFIPEQFPIDGKGMQPNSYLLNNSDDYNYAKEIWLNIKDGMINEAEAFYNLFNEFTDEDVHIHKQLVNRLLEPFMWHTVIVTATEWNNFFKLRCDENAQYEIRRIADLMYEAYHFGWNTALAEVAQIPILKIGEWHTPLVYKEDEELILDYLLQGNNPPNIEEVHEGIQQSVTEIKKKISVARCARVSYLTHDGKRDIEKDLELFERLRTSGHLVLFPPFFQV